MFKNKRYFYLLVLPLLVVFIFLSYHQVSNANMAGSNVVISQIQVAASASANQEFVELYNPTNASINMSGWRLIKEASSGAKTNLVASISGTIASHGYFLIAHPSYSNPSIMPDLFYSASSSGIANNNTIVLYTDAGQATVVDKVGFGTIPVTDFETAQFGINPAVGGALLRKASSGSTAESMSGAEVTSGNGYDTDNNADDFVVEGTSFPRNTHSPAANIIPTASIAPSITPTNTPIPTSTPTPMLIPTDTPTSTPSPTPTNSPTPTLTPTDTPTPTPTNTPTPTPTDTPTQEPTNTPTNTPTPTESPVVTVTLVPTVTPELSPTVVLSPTATPTSTQEQEDHHHFHHKFHFHYEIKHREIAFFGRHISIPFVHCYFR